jgi:uncharacterized protein YbbK (DUF523 family)
VQLCCTSYIGCDRVNILVSACLLGINTKYSGGSNNNAKLLELLRDPSHTLIPVCPEQLGGLSTPREPAEIQSGMAKDVLLGRAKVLNKQGADVTEQFVNGARETLEIARLYSCKAAILKAKSPSCGSGIVYDGTFEGKLKEGNGITVQLLLDNGIEVMDEENFEERLGSLK